MSFHLIHLAKKLIKNVEDPTITILGLSYKGNIDDVRESPSLKIKKIAESEGIKIKFYDPLVKDFPGNFLKLEEATKNSDCIILTSDHDIFKKIDPRKIKMRNKNVIDSRNILSSKKWRDAGFNLKLLGRKND